MNNLRKTTAFGSPFYESMQVVSAKECPQNASKQVIFKLNQFPKMTTNLHGNCHGGALATYIDLTTTIAIYAFDKKGRAHASTDLNMRFFHPGPISETKPIKIDAQVDKISRAFA